MVRNWQIWLSPRPLRRTETPAKNRMLSPNDAALYEFNYEDDGSLVVRETHYASNPSVREGLSGPPLHIHLTQTERFKVLQGRLALVLNGKELILTKDDEALIIPSGARHRFWSPPNPQEDIVFEVRAAPQGLPDGFDENYLRNALGYLRDCEEQKVPVSIFQVALLGNSSDTIFFCPPFWVPLWILKSVQTVAAVMGVIVFGYSATYPEYNTKPRPGFYGSNRRFE